MKTVILSCLLAWAVLSFGADASSISPPKEVKAALAAHDRAIHVKDGWIRDPYMIKGPDGYFYLTGTTLLSTTKETPEVKYSSGPPGHELHAWKTKDFIHWKSLGTPYSLKDGIWFSAKPERFKEVSESNWRLWAPEFHFINGKCAVIHTSPGPVNGANLSLARGLEPRRPWLNPMGAQVGQRHDPSLFQNDDGTWWMIWAGTSIAPLKSDLSDFAAEPIDIGPSGEIKQVGYEGCLMRKIAGKYILFGTAWSTGKGRKGSYNLYYATADKITGPYGERRFAGRFLGHGTPFQDNAGRWWCTAFFNANVPPLSRDGIQSRDLSQTAQTVNEQGLTLVPLEVKPGANDILIRAIDPAYMNPGPDELQKF
ncbi:MAG: family 43 glycosylhydrolase [Verrucomicrobia subdivision 3 bacterium]|nr:family 43 glycosylhydrolase [Limisphaerales bacterium]